MSWPWLLDPSSILVVTVEVTGWTKPPLHKFYSHVPCFSELFNCLAGVNLLKAVVLNFFQEEDQVADPLIIKLFQGKQFHWTRQCNFIIFIHKPLQINLFGFPDP